MYLKDYIVQRGKDVLIRFPKKVVRSFGYLGEFSRFRKMNKHRGPVRYRDAYPCLKDKLQQTPFDRHYVYHPAWAARILAETKPAEHIDISSILSFGTIVSAFIPVKFYDYRPADIQLTGYEAGAADLKKLIFDSDSIASLSCMHTIEHIGLGRYGDELDADGDIKAIAELKRVLKPGGDLLFVTPVGKARVEFNGQRIYSFEQVMRYFAPLELKDFTLIPDQGSVINKADPELIKSQNYACGCFWFRKLNP